MPDGLTSLYSRCADDPGGDWTLPFLIEIKKHGRTRRYDAAVLAVLKMRELRSGSLGGRILLAQQSRTRVCAVFFYCWDVWDKVR